MEITHKKQDFHCSPILINNSAPPSTSNPTNTTIIPLEDDEINNYKNKLTEKEKKFFSKLPSGYHFCPNDEDLVSYLQNKVHSQPLPFHRISDVNIYCHNPETLAAKFAEFEEYGKFYFFTPRNKKYKNGKRPNRAAVGGFWKATGADKFIKSNDEVVGHKKALVFYKGTPTSNEKTSWIMHEFRVLNPPRVIKTHEADMKLDDWVLCRIYNRFESQSKNSKGKRAVEDNETNTRASKSVKIANNRQLKMIEMSPSLNNEASTSRMVQNTNVDDYKCRYQQSRLLETNVIDVEPINQFNTGFHHPDSSIEGNYQGMVHQSNMYQHVENNSVLNSRDNNLVFGDFDAQRIMLLPIENGGSFESNNFQLQEQQEQFQWQQQQLEQFQRQESGLFDDFECRYQQSRLIENHVTGAQPINQFDTGFHHPDSSINGNYQGMVHQSNMYLHVENNNVLNSTNVVQESNLVFGDFDAQRIRLLPTENGGSYESNNFQLQQQQEQFQWQQKLEQFQCQQLPQQQLEWQQQQEQFQWQQQQEQFQWQQQQEQFQWQQQQQQEQFQWQQQLEQFQCQQQQQQLPQRQLEWQQQPQQLLEWQQQQPNPTQ